MFTPLFITSTKHAICLFITCLMAHTPMHRHHHPRPHLASAVWHHMTVIATQYVVNRAERFRCDTFTNRTASGSIARRGVVAIDTRLFHFGTRFKIPGYGFGIAADTGSAIIGQRLDLAVNSCREAFAWGSRRVVIAYR